MFFEVESNFDEQEFVDEHNRNASGGIQKAALVGLFFFDLHVAWDYFRAPELIGLFALLRIGLITPFVLAGTRLLSTEAGQQSARYLTLLMAMVVTGTSLLIHVLSNPTELPLHPMGVVFTILFNLTALSMLNREARIFSVSVIFAMLTVLFLHGASVETWIVNLVDVSLACALGVAVAGIVEEHSRNAFADRSRLKDEQSKSDKLLAATFPVGVIEKLKTAKGTFAEFAPEVTVLFADLEGFTRAVTDLSPEVLVAQLDAIFSRFDQLATENGCEKIKTIGDSFMAVSGIPMPSENHAEKVVRLGLAMQRAIQGFDLNGKSLTLRIGIHSGPVVAGVIGQSRFAYDLWGATVNVASRMESTAPSGGIQISAETHTRVEGKFKMVSRGQVHAKGIGDVESWLVQGELTAQTDRVKNLKAS